MEIAVLKFGGTSLSTFEKIKNISKIITQRLKKINKVIVVVSAMGNNTNKLIEKFLIYNNDHFNAEFDTVISSGEQVSSGLVAAYLNKRKIKARSVLGWQIPIETDQQYGKSKIKKIHNNNLISMLREYDVLVIGGFQGLNKFNRISTLGRGGSDTSAVAIAASIKAPVCEIFTDVEGVYTSDPRVVSNAKKINTISYEEILEMSSLGSKVLHPRSVELAMKYDIKIHVRSSFIKKKGTLVVKESKDLEKELVTGISSSDEDAKITLIGIPDKPGIAYKIFSSLAAKNLNIDMIVQNITDDGKLTSLTFTMNKNEVNVAEKALKGSRINFNAMHIDKKICKISVVGLGMKSHIGVAKKMFETLAKNKINIQVISTSEIKISVLILKSKKNIALKELHKAYRLDK
ncbi:MAG: aspartate kinase [Rickettsiales bacterium]|nr:aspartate kinase [Rickettsiales bacterium]OUV54255.1 MAG: aspartate kinase [Rickettsiales bacterium TMED127]|tara:strand:- start:9238 stop:10449 length:1212 start_codon:yes stop_codon:yes gene_type:complete